MLMPSATLGAWLVGRKRMSCNWSSVRDPVSEFLLDEEVLLRATEAGPEGVVDKL